MAPVWAVCAIAASRPVIQNLTTALSGAERGMPQYEIPAVLH